MKKLIKKKPTVTTNEVKNEKYPPAISPTYEHTQGTEFKKVEGAAEVGDLLLVDEGKYTTTFLVVHVGTKKVHMVDLSSEGEYEDSYFSATPVEVEKRKINGLEVALYKAEK